MHGIDQRGGCLGIDQYAQETDAYDSQKSMLDKSQFRCSSTK